MAREPSRAQFSKLAYQEEVPAFLQKLKARMSGQGVDEDEPAYGDDDDDKGDWEDSGDGRPAIPRRPGIPERPREGAWSSSRVGKEGEHGSGRDGDGKDDDDEGDDAPQIVVLKSGKHLTADDVENERRSAKGLPPLPKARSTDPSPQPTAPPVAKTNPLKDNKSMSFSSSNRKGSVSTGASAKKRKIIGTDDESPVTEGQESKPSKKPKKAKTALLSFQDDDG